jgi:probable rRNA maturation factor
MVANHHHNHGLDIAALRRRLGQAQAHTGTRTPFSLCLSNDAEVRGLNARFRGVNRATDVLSFPAEDSASYLGDIIISIDTARRQALQLGHSLDEEVQILALHGLLHLLGYDHENDRGEMRALEEQLRQALGLANGLIARSAGSTTCRDAGASRSRSARKRWA